MKKFYFTPKIMVVEFESSDLICTSGGIEGVEVTENEDAGARVRRNGMWDD